MTRNDISAAPKNLQGDMVHAYQKAMQAMRHMQTPRARRHRVVAMVKSTGYLVRRTKWETAHDHWQKRFGQAMRRLKPWEKLSDATTQPQKESM